jgi:hypothetical protein
MIVELLEKIGLTSKEKNIMISGYYLVCRK